MLVVVAYLCDITYYLLRTGRGFKIVLATLKFLVKFNFTGTYTVILGTIFLVKNSMVYMKLPIHTGQAWELWTKPSYSWSNRINMDQDDTIFSRKSEFRIDKQYIVM